MKCEETRTVIVQGIDRLFESREPKDAWEHIQGCPACGKVFENERRIVMACHDALAPLKPDRDLTANIIRRLPEAEELEELPTPGSKIIRWAIGLSAAAAILVAMFTGFFSSDPDGKGVKESVQAGATHSGEKGKESPLTLVLDKEKDIKMTFVWIKPGKFAMGSPENEEGRFADEKRHEVTLTKGYWMQTTEVTQGQWEAVMGKNPSYFKGQAELPVENVSWEDFQVFISKLNEKCMSQLAGLIRFDLPTEAEWEYACRAGSTVRWCFGDDESELSDYAWYKKNSGGKTHAVGQKKPNAWGLHDMHGNVWEWCKDWYQEEYSVRNVSDPDGPSSGQYRLLRGGSWCDDGGSARSADRGRIDPADQDSLTGGRLVLR